MQKLSEQLAQPHTKTEHHKSVRAVRLPLFSHFRPFLSFKLIRDNNGKLADLVGAGLLTILDGYTHPDTRKRSSSSVMHIVK